MQDNIKNKFYEKYGVDPNGSKLQNIDILNNRLFELKRNNADEIDILKCRIAISWAKKNVAGKTQSTAPISNILEDKSVKSRFRSSEVVIMDALRLIEAGKPEPAAVMLANERKCGSLEAGVIFDALNSNSSVSSSVKNAAASGEVTDPDEITDQFKKLLYYKNHGDGDKLLYEAAKYEKIAPVDANIILCEYFFEKKDLRDRSEGVTAANKLIKLKAKEGYFYLGSAKVLGIGCPKNGPEGKALLQKYIALSSNSGSLDEKNKALMPNAKVNWANEVFVDRNSTLNELLTAQAYYEEAISAGYNGYDKANAIKKKIQDKRLQIKRKRTKTIVGLSILFVVLCALAALVFFVIMPKFQKDKPLSSLTGDLYDMAGVSQDISDEEQKPLLSDYDLTVTDMIDDLTPISVSDISASSELTDSTGYVYKGINIYDGNTGTSWQENESGSGAGSILDVTLNETSEISGIAFLLGNHRSENAYYDNNRPSQILLKINDETYVYSFEDVMSWHRIDFDNPIEANEITIQLVEVYKGNKWDDTCISEIVIY